MRLGPHPRISSASGAAATAVPAKPRVPSSVARMTSWPSVSRPSSAAVRAPCTQVTAMPAERASRAARGIGATPSPPLMSATDFAPWRMSKPCPSGPRQLTEAPASSARRSRVPPPTGLSTTSIRSPSARYTENGRRSLKPPSRPRLTNWPALTVAAISGAANVSTHMSCATSRRATSGASSRNMRRASPLLDGADLEVEDRGRGRLEQRGRRVEGGEARDAALDRGPTNLEAVLDDGPALLARLFVDVRHGVDDQVDLAGGDHVQHRRPLLADLGDHARREPRLPESARRAVGGYELAAQLHQPRHDREHLRLVRVGDGQQHCAAARHLHAGGGERLAQGLRQRAVDADRLAGGLHLWAEV